MDSVCSRKSIKQGRQSNVTHRDIFCFSDTLALINGGRWAKEKGSKKCSSKRQIETNYQSSVEETKENKIAN